MRFRVNGQPRDYRGHPECSLLEYLRETENILSPKDGCSPQAACGCCTVEVSGRPVLACCQSMGKLAGKDVMTVEGLSPRLRDTFAKAFLEKGGVQCGFCIPAMVMRSKLLLDRNPAPSRHEVARALSPNLCRCTGYVKIVDSVLHAAEALRRGQPIELPASSGRIGVSHPKYEAYDLVLGQHPYVADMTLDGMLHAALKLSDHPRARILSLDTSEALLQPGVKGVFTVEDIPGDRHIGLIRQDWPLMLGPGDTTRYVGDVLAVVVADSGRRARQAVGRIRVEYEVFEPVTDPRAAMQPDSPPLHPGGNVLSQSVVQRGDVDRALAEAAFVSRGIYQTQCIEHGYMEPEAALARPGSGTGEGIEVFSQGQGVYEDRTQVAKVLGMPEGRVRVVQVSNGGAFGGKEDLSVQGHAALCAWRLGRPVRIVLNREESIRMHPKRHPLQMDYALACDAEGRLTALRANIVGDTGAYASVGMKVLERAAGHATGAYHVPAVDIVSTAVYTNNIPNGAMRGFGVNQVTFAMESCVDELCEQGGFDRWQLRYDNAVRDGSLTATGQRVASGAGVRATLLAVKQEFEAARCAGIACGIKNTGIGNGMPDSARVRIEVLPGGRVVVHHGWTEMGQGVHTMALQTFCEETGVDPAAVRVVVDTVAEAHAGMTTASRATSLVGNAIIDACKALKKDLERSSLEQLAGRVYRGEWTVDWTTKPGSEKGGEIRTHYSYSYATQVVTLDDEGRVERVTAAHDAGKIFNPQLFEGQIEGSIHMGLGYALSEDFPQEGGRPKSTHLRKMGILRSRQMPEVQIIGVEVPDPYGPYGAKGVGEIGLVPTAAAVANALFQFDGRRRRRLPMRVENAPSSTSR